MPVPTKKRKKRSSPTAELFGMASKMTSPRNAAGFLADAAFGENDLSKNVHELIGEIRAERRMH